MTDGDTTTTPPQSASPPHHLELEGEEAAEAVDSSFTAMPTFAPNVGLEESEGEENLRYIDEDQLKTEMEEESEEEDYPDLDIPYEAITEEQQQGGNSLGFLA